MELDRRRFRAPLARQSPAAPGSVDGLSGLAAIPRWRSGARARTHGLDRDKIRTDTRSCARRLDDRLAAHVLYAARRPYRICARLAATDDLSGGPGRSGAVFRPRTDGPVPNAVKHGLGQGFDDPKSRTACPVAGGPGPRGIRRYAHDGCGVRRTDHRWTARNGNR